MDPLFRRERIHVCEWDLAARGKIPNARDETVRTAQKYDDLRNDTMEILPPSCRAAGNRTRSLRTRSARTTGILRPEVEKEMDTLSLHLPREEGR